MIAAAELIQKCFTAYESGDRPLLESLLSNDFTFSSAVDDHLDRSEYFERCWPNHEHLKTFRIDKLFMDRDEAFVKYECERMDGSRFRNTEFFRIEGGKVKEVQVYFGAESGAEVAEAEVRALIDALVAACRAKDAGALMACYAPTVLAFDLITPLRYEGADQVRKRAGEWFASFQGPIEFEIRDLEILAGADVAFAYGLHHVIGTMNDGRKVDMWWRATLCCGKVKGHFVITHEHSSVPFDMETGQAMTGLQP